MSILNLAQFEEIIWAKHGALSEQMENYNQGLKDANSKILKKTTDHATNSHSFRFAISILTHLFIFIATMIDYF